MIIDIPSSDDFRNHGVDYLNLGWGGVTQILLDVGDAEGWSIELDDAMRAEFWRASERELATSLSLVEQGAEFLLKAKICEISPWLLISRDARDWPRRCDTEDIAYSKFHTIDGQDLFKIHNTFAQTRLPEEFKRVFDALRQQRNAIMHTVDINLRVPVVSLLNDILMVSDFLIGPHEWIRQRREFINRDRRSAFQVDDNEYRIVREFVAVMPLFTESELLRYFGFNKDQRAYACYDCCNAERDAPLDAFTAQLAPNTPASTELHCFLCDSTISVERQQCPNPDCKGNVYNPVWNICLSCQKEPEDFA